ncbi:hypothetical protein ACFFRR_002947 [Megaselia abdita]
MNITYSICRVCKIKGSESENLLQLDEEDLEKFKYCTNITISAKDGLPQQLCSKCKVRLKVSYEFSKQAIESHKDFENLLRKINIELESFSNVNSSRDDKDLNLLVSEENKTIVKIENSELQISDCITQSSEEDLTFQENDDIDCGDSESETTEVLMKEPTEQDELFNSAYFENIQEEAGVLEDFIEEDKVIVFEPSTKRDATQVFQCQHCNKNFSTKTNLVRHEHIHTGSKKFQCKICGNCFTQSGSLKQHMYIHTGERPFVCKDCGRSFTQSKSLKFHMRRHTGEKPFSCDFCNITFRQRDGLKRHVAVKHNKLFKDNPKNVCPHCLKKFTTMSRLQLHVKGHLEKGELFKCDLESCNELFSTAEDLRLHEFDHKDSQEVHIIETLII